MMQKHYPHFYFLLIGQKEFILQKHINILTGGTGTAVGDKEEEAVGRERKPIRGMYFLLWIVAQRIIFFAFRCSCLLVYFSIML